MLSDLRAQVRGLADRWRAEGRYQPMCDAWLRGYDIEFSRELARHGWIGVTWPRELGGAAHSNVARLVITEELLAAGAPVAAHWIADRQIGPAILRYGSRRLQEEFLPAITRAEVTFCLGMSETEAGSDLAAVRTRAVPDAGGWLLTGRKVWTSHAHRATHAYVLARTGEAGAARPGTARHSGLTEFIVDMAAPGVDVRPIPDLRGDHHFNEVVLDGVRVPGDHVLGTVGDGWRQVTEQLAFERGGLERVLSTFSLRSELATAVVDEAGVERVGELVARLQTLRGLAWRIARDMDAGAAPARLAAMLKYLGTAFERDVVEIARQVADVEAEPDGCGLAGLLGQAVLAAPGFTIRGGTNEVLLTVIARGEAV